jgi:hypothetical protein
MSRSPSRGGRGLSCRFADWAVSVRGERRPRPPHSLPDRASSIGVDAFVTLLDPPGNSEAGATEQGDPVLSAFTHRAAPPPQAAVVLEAAASLSNSPRPLSGSAAPARRSRQESRYRTAASPRSGWSGLRHSDERRVALAIIRCWAGARSKQSCGAVRTDARYWANSAARRHVRSPLLGAGVRHAMGVRALAAGSRPSLEQAARVATATAAWPGETTLSLNARPRASGRDTPVDFCIAGRIQRCHAREETAGGSPIQQRVIRFA